ncbi:hypothetical protein AB4K20DRAFT_1866078 [Rhizopus microsporus]
MIQANEYERNIKCQKLNLNAAPEERLLVSSIKLVEETVPLPKHALHESMYSIIKEWQAIYKSEIDYLLSMFLGCFSIFSMWPTLNVPENETNHERTFFVDYIMSIFQCFHDQVKYLQFQ